MDILSLNCWVRSQDVGRIFQVNISKKETVAALQKAIKNLKPVAFHDVDADAIPLYKPRDPLSRPYEENLSRFILSVHGELLQMGDDELSELFPEPPPKHHIHIIVDAPSINMCRLRGSTLNDSIPISFRLSTSEGISQLIHHIKDARPNLRDYNIRLYRISGNENELQESLDKPGDGELLQEGLLHHFLGIPVLDPLRIVAEVATDTIGKRQRSDLDLSRGKKRPHSLEVPEVPTAIVDFHSKIWDKRSDAHTTVFVTTPVERLRPQLAGVEVPSQCCIMKSPSCCNGSTRLSGIFIRNEFVLAVKNIVAFYKGENFGDDSQGNDGEVAESSLATQFPVDITNPFLAPDFPLRGKNTGVIIAGAPGIGKSVLLEFILHLRNLAGHPTIFVKRANRAYLFTREGVSTVLEDEIHGSKLPPNVWALVDSNRDLIGVPEWVTELGCFIVQAASPRLDRMQWEKKVGPVSRYILKMWSLEEVLAARMLQNSQPSEMELKTFFESYAPSARTAYHEASRNRIEEFEKTVQTAINSLTLDQVNVMVNKMDSLATNDETPHRLFIIQPGETRSFHILQFASQHVADMVIAALREKEADAIQQFFTMCNRQKTPGPKALAGQIFDTVIRGPFKRGGVWPIHQMEVSLNAGTTNQHWRIVSSKEYPDQYLVVGQHTKPIVRICVKRPDSHTEYDTLSQFPFDATTSRITETGYYIPTSKNEATFDAFYYDADCKEATILQATVSTSHTVKVKGLRRLQEVGVQSARYVAVTGPVEKFDLPVPKDHDGDFLKEKYHLVVSRLD